MFPLLLTIQANPLSTWATKKVLSRPCTATISIEKISTTHSKSNRATAFASRTLHPTGWTGPRVFQIRTITNIFIECTTRVGPRSIAWSNCWRLLNEWLSDSSQLLYHRLYEQSSGESRSEYWFSTSVRWIFYIIFDAHRTKRWNYSS